MLRPLAEFIDAYRIWHKITYQRGRILRTEGSRWELYDRAEHYAEPERVYDVDGRVPQVRVEPDRAHPLADVWRLGFDSLHPVAGYAYLQTNRAAGRLYTLRGVPAAPVAVVAHGWAHDRIRPIEAIYVEPLLRAGFSVALPSLPFHLERTPPGFYSGELMVSGDVVLTVESFRQSVADLSGLVSWLRDRGHRRVGILGYSLGGYLAALTACLRSDLDFVVIGAAGDSVVSPILETRLGTNVREDLSATGMHRPEALTRAWGIISPGRLRPRVARERILIVSGTWDRIMLKRSVAALWEAWGRPAIRWEDQGHYTLLAVPGRLVRRSLPFLRQWFDIATPA